MIQFAPLEAWGIRFHGKMWLKFTKFAPMGSEAYGWRRFTWTNNIGLAEKWASEATARAFAERRCIGPFEIAKIGPNQRSVDHPA